MKFLITNSYYHAFLKQLYQKQPNLKDLKFAEQREKIFNEHFGIADYYSKNLKKIGHDAGELVINNETLQRVWAKENNIKLKPEQIFLKKIPYLRRYLKRDWFYKILNEQIDFYKPDVLFTHVFFEDQKFLKSIKERGIKLVGQIASPLPDMRLFNSFDLVLSAAPHLAQAINEAGTQAINFKLGFEKDLLNYLKHGRMYNTVFIGTFSQKHKNRMNIFEYVAGKMNVDFWGSGDNFLKFNSPIKKNFHGPAWGLDMYNIMFNSKIVINNHIDMAENYAGNMRLYEAAGVGALVITDDKKNLGELFEIGKEIETYRTKEELAEKINYYLEHEEERARIAKAGQDRVLRDHTYEIRMKELVEILNKYF